MTSPPPIRAVSFDVGGTLIRPWPSVGQVYSDVAAKHGSPGLSPEILNRNFAAAWQSRTEFRHTEAEWAALVDQTFSGLTETPPSRSFFPALFHRFGQTEVWRVWEDVVPTLDELASRGIPLAVISNWDERLRPLLRQFHLDGYFEIIAISCEVAFTKPSPVIFEHTAQKLGFPPGSILHLGDSRAEDYLAARSAGFQARLVDRQSADTDQATLASLRELPALL